jgi:hypothetical protein
MLNSRSWQWLPGDILGQAVHAARRSEMYETASQYFAGNDDTLFAYSRRSIAALGAMCLREELANCETAGTPSNGLSEHVFLQYTLHFCLSLLDVVASPETISSRRAWACSRRHLEYF